MDSYIEWQHWLLGVEAQPHYARLDNVIFDFDQYAEFDPPYLDYEQKQYTEFNLNYVNIKNSQDNSTLSIDGVYTKSSDIFIHTNPKIVLQPLESYTINFSIYPTLNGHFSSIIYFSTSVGVIPYYISYFCAPNSVFTPIERHYYYSARVNNILNIHIENPKNHYVMYDSDVFSGEIAESTETRTSLSLRSLSPGLVTTFIYIISEGKVQYYPLFFHIYSEYLVPTQSSYFVTPYVKGQGKQVKFAVYNPLDLAIIVTRYEFGNVVYSRKDDEKQRLEFPFSETLNHINPHQKIILGSIPFIRSLKGSLRANLDITYRIENDRKQEGKLSIPVYISNLQGSVEVYKSTSQYIDPEGILGFKIYNNHKQALAILGIIVNTPYYKVSNFRPTIIPKNSISDEYNILIGNIPDARYSSIRVKIITNSTIIYETLRSKSNGVGIIGLNTSIKGASHKMMVEENNIVSEAYKRYNIRIINWNTAPFNVDHIYCTEGISISLVNQSQDLTVPPSSKRKLSFDVYFKKMPNIPRNDTVIFSSVYQNLTFAIQWTPQQGTLFVEMDPFTSNRVQFGKEYNVSLYIRSSLDKEVNIQSVETDVPSVVNFDGPIYSHPHSNIFLASLDFSLNETFTPSHGFFDIANMNQDIESQYIVWDSNWPSPINITYNIITKTTTGQFFKHNITFIMNPAVMKDQTFVFDQIYTGEIGSGFVYLENNYDVAVELTFHNTTGNNTDAWNIVYDSGMVIEPRSTKRFEFLIDAIKEGVYVLTIHATTNISKPFVITITANIVFPSIRFTDEDGKSVPVVTFAGGDEYFYSGDPWTNCVYLQTTEVGLISLGKQTINAPYIEIDRNTDTLMPGDSSMVCFTLDVWLYNGTDTELTYTVDVNGTDYYLPVIVALAPPVVERIRGAVSSTIAFVAIVGLLIPLLRRVVGFGGLLWRMRGAWWRVQHRQAAVRHFSVNERASAAVQKEEEKGERNTRWRSVRRPEGLPMFATPDALHIMEMMLH